MMGSQKLLKGAVDKFKFVCAHLLQKETAPLDQIVQYLFANLIVTLTQLTDHVLAIGNCAFTHHPVSQFT